MNENREDARLDFLVVTELVDTTAILRDKIRYGANRKVFLEENKEKQVRCACDEVVGLLSRVNRILRNELIPILDVCTTDAFAEDLQELLQDVGLEELYTSPDFQCDQTGGFPTSLQVCWKKNKAWLVLNETLIEEGQDVSVPRYQCAQFGIRECRDVEQYSSILKELGREAYEQANIEEGVAMTQC